jgi:hypothetical protein
MPTRKKKNIKRNKVKMSYGAIEDRRRITHFHLSCSLFCPYDIRSHKNVSFVVIHRLTTHKNVHFRECKFVTSLTHLTVALRAIVFSPQPNESNL